LNAEVNWYRIFNELIEGFDEAAVAKKQSDALGLFGIPVPQ
jgi:hypothetical protein